MRTILETPRFILREMTEADADQLVRLNANPNVIRYVGEGPVAGTEAALELLHTRVFPQYARHGVGRWAVIRKDDDRYVGWCGLKYLEDTREYDLGYRFYEEHWGRGYATETARAVLDWARAHLPNVRIVGKAHVDNSASIRVLEKLGLRFEAHADDPVLGRLAVYVVDR
jgi:[ribosomal protein S5]-alanine N-acetyltransferase